MKSEIFRDLVIVELAGVLAGPAAGMFFAELGARVIKIENKRTNGDAIRNWKLPAETAGSKTSAYYQSVNWNKEVVFLDFHQEKDLERLQEYITSADILLTNFKEDDARKLKLDHHSLRKQYPELIIAEIKGFANENRLAYDAVLQAETGFMSINGTKESGPLKMPVALIDVLAAHHLKEGILVALIRKAATGKGAHVCVSLEEAAIASLANQAAGYLNTGVVPGLAGSLHPVIAPYGEIFVTADTKQIMMAVGTDLQFQKLCAVLNLAEISSDPRFATNYYRVIHRNDLAALLQNSIEKFQSAQLMERFINEGIPAGLIRNIRDVFETKTGQSMILNQYEENNQISRRVRTAIFTINPTDGDI